MTCIVGLVDKDDVWIGGDSAGVGGFTLYNRQDEKVFKVRPRPGEEWLFGFTSSFRMGQVLRFGFDIPERNARTDLYEFMVTDFVDAVRKRFKTAGFATRELEVESGGCFLVAHDGRLFSIEDDYQVGEYRDGYYSVGCGADFALGSMHATKGRKPQTRLRSALNAAAYFSAGVAPPFVIRKTARR